MAKIDMTVQLKNNSGVSLGGPIAVSNKATKSEAEAAVAAVIQQRVDAATGAAADLQDAQNAFNA